MRVTSSFTHLFCVHLQTLEQAFLQLCETSDQIGSKRESIPPGGTLDQSQSFESAKDERRPILGVRLLPGEEIPKCSGRHCVGRCVMVCIEL